MLCSEDSTSGAGGLCRGISWTRFRLSISRKRLVIRGRRSERSIGARLRGCERLPWGRHPGADCADSSARLLQDRDFSLQPGPQPVSPHLEVIAHLQVQPETLRRSKEAGETEGGVRRDSPLSQNDLVDAAGRHLRLLRESVLRQAEGLEKLRPKDLAGMNG